MQPQITPNKQMSIPEIDKTSINYDYFVVALPQKYFFIICRATGTS